MKNSIKSVNLTSASDPKSERGKNVLSEAQNSSFLKWHVQMLFLISIEKTTGKGRFLSDGNVNEM